MANSKFNWKCLKLVCNKINLKELWAFEALVFYKDDVKQLTCAKSNRFREREFEDILRQINLSENQYLEYVKKCKQKLHPN